MLTLKRLLFMPLAALLVACTTPTPYQPAGEAGRGFADATIAADRHRVSFKGNSRTTRETVELYVLYRAAEVTLDSGAEGFVIVDRDTEVHTTYVGTGFGHHPRLFPRRHGARFHAGLFPTFGTYDAVPVRRYEAFAEIRTFQGPRPVGDDSYDAREVIASLGPKITLPEEE
ncbi:MAG: hypothetical protein AAF367_15730 [Pseudomonadota bacterium]